MLARPVRTGSARQTIESLRYLAAELDQAVLAYRSDKTARNLETVESLFDQLVSLVDMSAVPSASRRERGVTTALALLDIVARVDLPPTAEVPGDGALADEPNPSWRLPLTPLRLVRLDDGPRQGEHLFSSTTVRSAPRFASTLTDEPMTSDLAFTTWSRGWPQITGPMISADLVRDMPDDLRMLWHGTPRWKAIAVAVALIAGALVLAGFTRTVWPGANDGRSRRLLRRLVPPVAALAGIAALDWFFGNELNLSGDFASWVGSGMVVLTHLALAWLFWVLVTGLFNWMTETRNGPRESLNTSLVKLGARILGVIGILLILGLGATRLGLPVLSVVAGLGVGSLAVALAVRPSLENLIGGFVLFADRPVRVGDFCSFGSFMGTVESIGIRSTQIRGLDRTLIAVPNAKFADMEIINWAQCDRMLINETIGLRYETRPDQLRYILRNLRAMVHAHPRIENETTRIRFTGYGDSSLNIGIRIYAQTREWNDFYAIREDVFLRVYEIVEEAGTDFAVPASRMYVTRDQGLETGRTQHATESVEDWRSTGTLPFPFMSEEQVREAAGSVAYPPRGSVQLGASTVTRRHRAERLSEETAEEQAAREAEAAETARRATRG